VQCGFCTPGVIMAAKAKVGKSWIVRMSLLSVVFIGFGLWCVYDGMVTYPKLNKAITTYQELEEKNDGYKYKEMAEENGWPAAEDR